MSALTFLAKILWNFFLTFLVFSPRYKDLKLSKMDLLKTKGVLGSMQSLASGAKFGAGNAANFGKDAGAGGAAGLTKGLGSLRGKMGMVEVGRSTSAPNVVPPTSKQRPANALSKTGFVEEAGTSTTAAPPAAAPAATDPDAPTKVNDDDPNAPQPEAPAGQKNGGDPVADPADPFEPPLAHKIPHGMDLDVHRGSIVELVVHKKNANAEKGLDAGKKPAPAAPGSATPAVAGAGAAGPAGAPGAATGTPGAAAEAGAPGAAPGAPAPDDGTPEPAIMPFARRYTGLEETGFINLETDLNKPPNPVRWCARGVKR